MRTSPETFEETPPTPIPRIPTSHIPREVATRALLAKSTARSKRLFARARYMVVDLPRQEPKDPQIAFCARIKRLTMRQLGRRLTQARHKIAPLERLLENTHLDSFRKPIEKALEMLRYQIGWLEQEAESRVYLTKETINTTGN